MTEFCTWHIFSAKKGREDIVFMDGYDVYIYTHFWNGYRTPYFHHNFANSVNSLLQMSQVSSY